MDEVDQLVRHHYDNRQLDRGRADAILKSCDPARQVYRWRSFAIASFSAAAAAILALLLVATGMFRPSDPGTAPIAENGEATVPESPNPFELIAVKIHADPCRRCHKLEPIFAGLKQQFAEKPVLFLTFDHTSKESRRQAQLLSEQLGIAEVYEKHRYTGVIVLVNREGVVRGLVGSNDAIADAAEVLERTLGSG